MNKVTINDVAKYCGVSIKTVSRVINNDKNVKPETRKNVLEAMKKLEYQVNILARGLKKLKTNIIIIFVDRHQEEHMSIWHTVFLKKIYKYAKLNNLKVITSPSNADSYLEDDTDGFYLLASGMADGAILLETVNNDKRIEFFNKKNIPYVVFGQPNEENACFVSLNNYQIGYKGTEYLIKKGYKNICFLLGEQKFLSTQLRVDGFKKAVEEHNIQGLVEYGASTSMKAYTLTEKVLNNSHVDAFFVSGDERALGVLKKMHELNIKIPNNIAVLGVDNLEICDYMWPSLSSMTQDFDKMAYTCIDILKKLMQGFIIKNSEKHIIIDTNIVERMST